MAQQTINDGEAGSSVRNKINGMMTEIYSTSIGLIPRLVFWVYGDSTDGGTTPDSTTQTSIDTLLAAGIQSANIRWLYTAGNSLVIAPMNVSVTMDNITITNATGGTLSIDEMLCLVSMDNIVITQSAQTITFDAAFKSSYITLSGDLLTATPTNSALWRSVRGTASVSTGNRYFELELTGTTGSNGGGIALCNSTVSDFETFFGSDTNGIMMTSINGNSYFNGTGTGLGLTGTGTHRLTLAWESATGKVWFAKNGTPNVAGAHHGILAGPVFPGASFNAASGITGILKIPSASWSYAAPSGFTAMGV